MSNDDDDLWQFVSESVEPIQRGKLYVEPVPEREKPEEKPQKVEKTAQRSSVPSEQVKPALYNDGLDRRTAERLRKGQMPIDATLDLHGLNRSQAYAQLRQFLKTSQARGDRCVLVITGKGSGGKTSDQFWEGHGAGATGVLKKAVPEWLAEADLQPIVLKWALAQPKDGGHGALYVLLRRQR